MQQRNTSSKTINPWLIFILICVPILIGSIDLTSIVVVLPQATLDLLGPKGLSKAGAALWAVTAYLLAYTISLALVGRLSDVVSRKRVFIACIVIFISGSVWAGLATELPLTLLKLLPIWPDPESLPLVSLVIGRIIQAIGAGASVSVGMALVSDIFPPDKRAEPISLIGALDSLGWVVGNLYAGLLLQVLPSWRWLFLINAGVAAIALLFTVLALRGVHSGKVTNAGRYDTRGAVVFASALITLTIGIELLSDGTPLAYILTGGSVVLFVIFGWLQLRTRNPLLDIKFIRQREVRAALITNLIVGFCLILIVAGIPLVINLRTLFLRGEGLLTGALRAGIMLCALTFPLFVAVLVGESRYRRLGAGIPVAIGLAIAAVGFLLASVLWTYTAPNFVIALPLAVIGVGLGLTIGPLSLVVVDAAEESSRGLASSLVLTMRLLGMTFGTPPAASLTIKLANDWASARVVTYADSVRDLARIMLVPPMATTALSFVMLAGAGACALGLAIFYLPRAYRAVKQLGIGSRAVFRGTPALIVAVIIVGVVTVIDSQTTPAIVPNPIARQLPPNVEFYAGFNIQQMFIRDSERPLDALTAILAAPPDVPTPSDTPAATAIPPVSPSATPTLSLATPQPTNPPVIATPADTPLDSILKSLFRPHSWSNANYKAFCDSDLSPDQWPLCFKSGLLSWVGPQAAFALLPRTRADYDYVFVFQATNRNNAIQFASNLATALGEKEPVDIRPNVRVLTTNAGTPDERRLAITDAYVIVGTAQAVEYTLDHGNLSLADQPDYQTVTGQLPADEFATFYFRSNNFDSDVRPALNSLFSSSLIDTGSRIASRASPFFFTRTATTPTLIGLSLHIDEQQLALNIVANFPYSLDKLNAAPVTRQLLSMIPASKARAWLAANLNIAAMAREISIPDTLALLAQESPVGILHDLSTNTFAQKFVTSFGQSLQTVLTHAQGQAIVLMLPGHSGSIRGDTALILPLADKENIRAADAVGIIKGQLQMFTLSGQLAVDTQVATRTSGEIITVTGKALEAIMPGGFQYTLTPDNVLIISTGSSLASLLETLDSGSEVAAAQITDSVPGQLDKFLYGYVAPSAQPNAPNLLLGGQIKRQTLYLNLILQSRTP